MAVVRTKPRSCVLFLLSGLLLIVLRAGGIVLAINPVSSGLNQTEKKSVEREVSIMKKFGSFFYLS